MPISPPTLPARTRRVVAAVAAATVVVALTSVAYAAFVNTASLGGPGSGQGELDVPKRAAIEQDTGYLYVVDSGNDRVQIFGRSGGTAQYLTEFGADVLESPSGIAIDESASETVVYVTSETNGGEIVKFEFVPSVNPILVVDGGYSSPDQGSGADQIQSFDSALALAPNGDVWVADSGAGVVKRFDSDGAHVAGSNFDGSAGATAFTGLLDLASDAAGDLYLVDADGPIKSGPDGTPEPTGTARALRYGADGAFKAELTPVGPSQRPARVTVDKSTGTVAVSGEQDAIYRDADPTVHLFGPDDAFVEELSVTGPSSYETVAGLAFSTDADRLYVVTDYGYWQNGDSYGSQPGIQIYRDVLLVPPVVTISDDVTSIDHNQATVYGAVDANGLEITCGFEFVADEQFQVDGFDSAQATSCSPVPSGDDPVDVRAGLGGLSPDTTYHYRLHATGAGGSDTSAARTFTTTPLFPPEVSIDAVADVGASAATLAGTVDPNGRATTYRFEYRLSGAPEWTATATEDAGAGDDPAPVGAEVDGLRPVADYEARLAAANEHGQATSEIVEFSTTSGPPIATTVPAGDVTDGDARLRARVNPAGEQTSFNFEWGTTTDYGNAIPVAPVALGSGNEYMSVARAITGLQPETTYHFRVVARNVHGVTEGPDSTFTTDAVPDPCPNAELRARQRATHLADCRAYELVSPAAKNGADVAVHPTRTRISASETAQLPRAVTFTSLGGFADARGSGVGFDYMAQRTAKPGTQGWATHALTPHQQGMTFDDISKGGDPLYVGDGDPNLTRGVFQAYSAIGPAPNTDRIRNLYLRRDLRSPGAGDYQLLTDAFAPTPPNPIFLATDLPFIAGASKDLSHVMFESRFKLTPDAPTARGLSKAYMSADGVVSYLGQVPPDDETICAGAECVPATGLTIAGQSAGSVGTFGPVFVPNPVSDDGSRAFFSAAAGASDADRALSRIYLRDDQGTADPSDDTTTRVGASEASASDTPNGATYWDAAVDGSKAFFTSAERLTDDAADGPVKLYRWSAEPDGEGRHLELLSVDGQDDSGGTTMIGVLGASDDGDTVYFVHRSQIVSDGPSLGNGLGIYMWRADEGVSFLGRMADDVSDPGENLTSGSRQVTRQLGARISPSGDHLLISLRQPPAPDGPEHGECANPVAGSGATGCPQLYRYDASTDDLLQCVTCDAGGPPPTRSSFFHQPVGTGAARHTTHLTSPLADDGGRVFFSSPAALVGSDVNGRYDAYMWEAPGHGTCRTAKVNGGCVSLLSSGRSTDDSYFVESSPDGADAMIATRERLVGWDVDDSRDLYDVRVEGGFPEPPPGQAPCQSHVGCQGQSTAPPPAERPGSRDLAGEGNPKPVAKAAPCSAARRRLTSHRRKLARAQTVRQRRKAKRAVKRARRQLVACRSGK